MLELSSLEHRKVVVETMVPRVKDEHLEAEGGGGNDKVCERKCSGDEHCGYCVNVERGAAAEENEKGEGGEYKVLVRSVRRQLRPCLLFLCTFLFETMASDV